MPRYLDTALKQSPFAVLASMTKHHEDEVIHQRGLRSRAVRLAEEMDDEWPLMDDPQEIDEILRAELGTTLDTMN